MFSKIIFHQTIAHHIFDSTKQVLKQQLKHSLSKNDCIQLNSADTHVLVTLPLINKRVSENPQTRQYVAFKFA